MAKDIFVPKGKFIFREGETGGHAYVIKSGSIEIIKTALDGEMVLANLADPNEIFGEMALIDNTPRSAGARATTDSTVTEIHQSDFLTYVQKHPAAAMNIMRSLSQDLRAANKTVSLLHSPNQNQISNTEPLETSGEQKPHDIDDTDAIYDMPASKIVMYLSSVLLLLLVAGIFFSLTSVVDTSVSTRGKFTTMVPNVEVQATSGAIVRELRVKRGEVVEQGRLVVVLDSIAAEADLASNNERLQASKARLRRLELEQILLRSGLTAPLDHGLDPLNLDILNKRLEGYRSKIRFFSAKLKQITREIERAREEVAVAEGLLTITEQQLALKKHIEEVHADLYEGGVRPLLSYLQASDVVLEVQRSHFEAANNININISAMNSKLSERDLIQAQQNEFTAEWLSALGENLAAEQELFGQLTQESLKLTQSVEDVEIRTPVDGVVLDLPTVSVGSIVQKGERLITLVPSNQPLTLEIDIDPKDIGEIKVNLPVSIKLDALPFQQFGDIKGNLIYLSEDTYDLSLSGVEGAFYRGRVDVQARGLSHLPAGFRLTPGMLANADIKIGERRLFNYLVNPIIKGFSTAFSEPNR